MGKDPRTHAGIGAMMESHRVMGTGHLEAVYQECLEIEFEERNIPFWRKIVTVQEVYQYTGKILSGNNS